MSLNAKYEVLSTSGDDAGATDLRIVSEGRTPWDNFMQGNRTTLPPRRLCFLLTIVSMLLLLFTGFSGFICGIMLQQTGEGQLGWLAPSGGIDIVFRYQKQFALRSDNGTTALWESLFPRGNGFVKHPELSPEPTCIAVYHQLHCLDAIRNGYWAAVDGVEPSHHARPAHVRHCIDYLRQALMCHADTNLEPVVEDLGGVSGFGSERKCRDYRRVTAWADEWTAKE